MQVGKTTIIRKFLAQSGLSADGFVTYWEPDRDGGESLFLSPYSPDLHAVEKHLITHRNDGQSLRGANLGHIFDTQGARILDSSGKLDIIIMDELGFLETQSTVFQNAVLRHISGKVPILGAIKPESTAFLDKIRAYCNVTIREITAENREAELAFVISALKK